MNTTENTEILQDIWVSLNKENKEDLHYSEGLFEGNTNYSIYLVIAISYVN